MDDPRRLLPGLVERAEVLTDYLREMAGARVSFVAALTKGLGSGWSMQELLPRIEPSVEGTAFDEATGRLCADAAPDWVAVLVESAGSVDLAQQWLDEAGAPLCWGRATPAARLRVAHHYDGSPRAKAARQRLAELMAERAPLDALHAAICDDLTPPWTRPAAWLRALRQRPLAEVMSSSHVPGDVVRRIRESRGSVWNQLVELHRTVDLATFVELGERIAPWTATRPGLRRDVLVERAVNTLLDGAVVSDISRWEVLSMMPDGGDPVGWLEAFRHAGFDENAAALACVEAGLSIAASARAMVDAGYPDGQVLQGIRANGRGIERVVRELVADGWPRDRLVPMLEVNGALPPEVLEILRTTQPHS